MPEPESLESFVRTVATQTWEVFRRDALTYVLAAVIVSLLSVVTVGIAAGPMTVGFLDLVRRASRGEPIQVDQVFSGFQRFWPSAIAVLLIVLAASIGFALLVVPGFLVLLFTCFTLQAIAYENLSATDALRRSFGMVRERFLHALVVVVLISILQSLGGSIVLGVLLSAPLGLIGLTLSYERLAQSMPNPSGVPPGVIVR
jgi:uncharacterized membrane protein